MLAPELAWQPALRLGLLAETPAEPLDLTASVHQALFASEERMTFRTEIDTQALSGRLRLPGVSARATCRRINVLWMNTGFHTPTSAGAAGWTLTCFLNLLARSNFTLPSMNANNV